MMESQLIGEDVESGVPEYYSVEKYRDSVVSSEGALDSQTVTDSTSFIVRISPPPDDTYTLNIKGWLQSPDLTLDTDTHVLFDIDPQLVIYEAVLILESQYLNFSRTEALSFAIERKLLALDMDQADRESRIPTSRPR